MLRERFNGYVEVMHEKRAIYGSVTPELESLRRINSLMFAEWGIDLCQNSPVNMVGSLLIGLNQKELTEPFTDHGLEVPYDITHPFTVEDNIPIVTYNTDSGRFKRTPFMAEQVLYKHASGHKKVGIVLQGPLTGTFLYNPSFFPKSEKHAQSAARVWNNSFLPSSCLPYPPCIYRHLPETLTFNGSVDPSWDRENFKEEWIKKYNDLYLTSENTMFANGGNPTMLDLFFYVCDQSDIPVDKEHFVFSMGL